MADSNYSGACNRPKSWLVRHSSTAKVVCPLLFSGHNPVSLLYVSYRNHEVSSFLLSILSLPLHTVILAQQLTNCLKYAYLRGPYVKRSELIVMFFNLVERGAPWVHFPNYLIHSRFIIDPFGTIIKFMSTLPLDLILIMTTDIENLKRTCLPNMSSGRLIVTRLRSFCFAKT